MHCKNTLPHTVIHTAIRNAIRTATRTATRTVTHTLSASAALCVLFLEEWLVNKIGLWQIELIREKCVGFATNVKCVGFATNVIGSTIAEKCGDLRDDSLTTATDKTRKRHRQRRRRRRGRRRRQRQRYRQRKCMSVEMSSQVEGSGQVRGD